MRLELRLSKREAEALLKAELSTGYGVIRSQALQSAEFKIKDAVLRAQRDEAERSGVKKRGRPSEVIGRTGISGHLSRTSVPDAR